MATPVLHEPSFAVARGEAAVISKIMQPTADDGRDQTVRNTKLIRAILRSISPNDLIKVAKELGYELTYEETVL